MKYKANETERAFLRKYPQEPEFKARIFSNRISSSPRPVSIISGIVATIVGRKRFIDSLFPKIPGANLFYRFLVGNMALIALSPTSLPPQKSYQFDSNKDDFTKEIFDLIVVGSGPGGAIAALRSAEIGKKVLVIEAGYSYEAGSVEHHSLSQTEYQFKDSGLSFIYGTKPVIYAEGRTLGGGSEVNSGLYHRLEGFHRDNILKTFGVSESEWSEIELLVEAELSVQTSPIPFEPNHGLILGARHMGLIAREIPRWRTYEPEEKHQSMQSTYLIKALHKGVKFQTGERVFGISNEERIEVISRTSDGLIKKYKSKEVVLACGAIQTPSLLNSSGILKCNFPLNFHPMLRAVASQDVSINHGDLFPSWQAWTQDLKFKYGYSVSTYPYLAATLKSMGETRDFSKEELSTMAAYFGSFAIEDSKVNLLRLRNRLIPVVFWGRKDQHSIHHVSESLKQILRRGNAKEIWPISGSSAITTVHLFGSLPISRFNGIDNRGRLITDKRIRISDSSLMPQAPWGNPQGPIMVMCELLSRKNQDG
jgi:hypothetical protein